MSKKDFNQGIQTGLRISEELLNKEAKAMDYLKNKMDGMALAQEEMKKAVNNVLELYTKDALEKYYGICNALSPKDLQEPEKKVLLDILSTLAFQIDNFNKSQKLYLSNLKQYLELGEYNPNVNYDFELIENIKDLDSQEIILKCVREFMFLEEEDFSFVETIEEVLEYFSIKTKIIRKIDDCISITHYLLGVNGVIQMYGNHDLEKYLEGENEELLNFELEELCLEGDIVINKGEEKVYSKKLIRFNCKIECYGKIVFNECKLEYSTGDTIVMNDNSCVEIKNCFIKGSVGKEERNSFIHTCYDSTVSIHINNCIFKDSNYFLEAELESDVYINLCEIYDCNDLFKISGNNTVIKNSLFCIKGKIDENHSLYRDKLENKLIDAFTFTGEGIDILNCRFEYDVESSSNQEEVRMYFIDGKINKLFNCSFYKTPIRLDLRKAELCDFVECSDIGHNYNEKQEIIDCTFYRCKDVFRDLNTEMLIRGCQFVECEEKICTLYNNSKMEQCEFYNIKGEINNLISVHITEKYTDLSIKNCAFKGVNLKGARLIAMLCNIKKDSPVLYIDNCKLECAKISNSIGKAIEDTELRKGLFGKEQTVKLVSLRDCSGFDNISHDSGICSDYVINEKNKNGESIGCSEDIKEGIAGKIANYINKGLATVI